MASDAAAIALQAGKSVIAAIEMLKTGCGVLTAAIYDIRTGISALEQQYPELARCFRDVRDKLDALTSRNLIGEITESHFLSLQAEADSRRQAGQQLETLVRKIRSKPGF